MLYKISGFDRFLETGHNKGGGKTTTNIILSSDQNMSLLCNNTPLYCYFEKLAVLFQRELVFSVPSGENYTTPLF